MAEKAGEELARTLADRGMGGQIKHDVKARLTLSASGSHGGEGARTHIQVLANSIVATGLILLHRWALAASGQPGRGFFAEGPRTPEDLLVVGIVA